MLSGLLRGKRAMIPSNVFESLTRAPGLRVERRASERRSAARIAVRAVASACGIQHGTVGQAIPIRVRDLSTTGISFITPSSVRIPAEFLIRIQSAVASRSGTGAYWLWCQYRRRTECDRTCILTSASFMKILMPGSAVYPGMEVNRVSWVDVEGDTTPSESVFRVVA
jgi:hypothetical protein